MNTTDSTIAVTQDLPTKRYWATAFSGVVVALGAWAWLGWGSPTECDRLPYIAAFAGEESRFRSGLQVFGCGSLEPTEARILMGIAIAATALLGWLLVSLMIQMWPRGWRSAPFRHWTNLQILPITGTTLVILAEALTLFVIRGDGEAVSIHGWAARALPVLAGPGSVLLFVSVVLIAFATLGTLGSRGTPHPDSLVAVDAMNLSTTAPSDVGVCVSGGGIRAGSVALGALWKLEQTDASNLNSLSGQLDEYLEQRRTILSGEGRSDEGIEADLQSERQKFLATKECILDKTRYLASVSGGGYVAGAYRIAQGVPPAQRPDWTLWKDGAIFGPEGDVLDDEAKSSFDDPDEVAIPYHLRQHVLSRRRFLLTGRGGIVGSLTLVVWGLAMQAALIALAVFLFAWPLGRLSASWAVVDGRDLENFDVASRHWLTPAVLISVAILLILSIVLMWNTTKRQVRERLILGLAAGSAASAVLLLAVPIVVADFSIGGLVALFAASSALLGGTIGALASRILNARLANRLPQLGGVLLAVVVAVLALIVASEAAAEGGAFNNDWWRLGYAVALLMFILGWSYLDPRWWSLHILYRHRLRGAFAVTTDRARAQSGHPWVKKFQDDPGVFPMSSKGEPQLDEYVGARPEPLICASAARNSRTATGISALSFVLSPSEVVFYDIGGPPESTEVHRYARPTDKYLDFIGPKRIADDPWHSTSGRRRQALGTMTTAMSLSGAAVSSSMGRSSLGTTNALLAALNVSLGTWLPNPRYVPDGTQQTVDFPNKTKRSRLNYRLKEILGGYDTDEPYLYVTDGGHRENLGIVELLRRRCKVIICIDASGDAPGSFSTLMQAARLARTEVGAELKFADTKGANLLDDLRAKDGFSLPITCAARIPIHYDNDPNPSGWLLYAKNVVDRNDPLLIAFREEDPDFPNYSTGNQFLTEDQTRMLVRLGHHMATAAIKLGKQPVSAGSGNGILTAALQPRS